MINWINIFKSEGIHYVTAGRNTSRGYISIKCPFCLDDPSEHLGVHLSSGKWTCWRDSTHRGIHPEYLLIRLLGISKASAELLIETHSNSNLDEFGVPETVKTLNSGTSRPTLPTEFRPIEADSLTHKFWQYLYDRGFDDPDDLISQYDLQACLLGRWNGRIIIPIYDKIGLIGWQGRAIQKSDTAPKYLTSSELVKQTIFNLNNLDNGDTLFICEGPFDALKVDYYGKEFGLRATCLFGVNFTIEQVSQLIALCNRFNHLKLLLDNDAPGTIAGFSLSDYLPQLEFGQLPDGVSDPGSLTQQQVLRLSNDRQKHNRKE